ncbi:hypothetical protein CsSME_00041279 [Camellia sinensis var. sinensis]
MPEIEHVPMTSSSSSSVTKMDNALFGKYELGKLLGCGAFAKVYHARNISTGQSVAVKVINKNKIAGTNVVRLKKKKEWGVELEGLNGNFMIGLEVFPLTDNLVVVEVRPTGSSGCMYNQVWKNKIRPELISLQQEQQVAGN